MSEHLSQLEQAYRFSNLRDVDKNRGDIRKVADSCYYRDKPNGKRLPRINESIKDHAINWCLARSRVSGTSYLDTDTGLMKVTFRIEGNRTPDGNWIGSREDFGKQAGLTTTTKSVSMDTLTATLRWLEMVGLITRCNQSWKSKKAGEEGQLRYQGSAVIVRFNYPKWTALVMEAAAEKRKSRNHRTTNGVMDTTIDTDGEGENCRILAVMETEDTVIDYELSEAAFDAADVGFSNDPRERIYSRRIRVQYASLKQVVGKEANEAEEAPRSSGVEAIELEASGKAKRATLQPGEAGLKLLEDSGRDRADAQELGPVLDEPAASKGLDPRLLQDGLYGIQDSRKGFQFEPIIPEEDTVACGSMYFKGHNGPGGSVETRRNLIQLSCSPEAFDIYNLFLTAAAKIGVRCLDPDGFRLSQQILARISSPNMAPDQRITERTIGLVFQSISNMLNDPADEKERQRAWGITLENLVAKWPVYVRGSQDAAMHYDSRTLSSHWGPHVDKLAEIRGLQMSAVQKYQEIWKKFVDGFIDVYAGKMGPGPLGIRFGVLHDSALHFWVAFNTYLLGNSPEQARALELNPELFPTIAATKTGQMAFLQALNYYKGGDLYAAGVLPVFADLMLRLGSHETKRHCRDLVAPVVQRLIREHCPEFSYEGATVIGGIRDIAKEGEHVRRQRLLQVTSEYARMGMDITKVPAIRIGRMGEMVTIGELEARRAKDPVAQFVVSGLAAAA